MHNPEVSIDQEQKRNIRRLLWRWGSALYHIRQMERELQEYLHLVDDSYNMLRGKRSYDDTGGKTGPSSGVERAIEDAERRKETYEKLAEILTREIDQELRLKESIDEIVSEMDDVTQKVLTMRYVDCHKWRYIGLRMCYNERHVKRLESEAVEKLARNVTFSVL